MTAQTPQTPVRPVAGPKFRQVAAMPIEGAKRRKLVALLAAFEDAGQASITLAQLVDRLGWDRRQVAALLVRLRDDGYVKRTRAGRWRVVLPPAEGSS